MGLCRFAGVEHAMFDILGSVMYMIPDRASGVGNQQKWDSF